MPKTNCFMPYICAYWTFVRDTIGFRTQRIMLFAHTVFFSFRTPAFDQYLLLYSGTSVSFSSTGLSLHSFPTIGARELDVVPQGAADNSYVLQETLKNAEVRGGRGRNKMSIFNVSFKS